ncbi:G-alpha-domain-containing protein [Laetiporus sulphureus 93-53]|uniref:G-alpha-domain-containing protein n=1 Tax=Laetiporus sulphureus 93-53 TaxID=1314785 RepID=A0A165BB21_9APHY|nr:G-alpha-domain-containing protein [Laetiporus sulphureus 93-53]KZT00652.1 G-alpha-domain-containing protein [Laetiporus sulphureus 93-53]
MPGREPPDHDPLDAVLRPPIDETPEEKAFRLAQEEDARRVSQAIDESIRLEKQQRKKMKVVRLLLLGQSESGKSTTLRQFQRLYTPSAFREERILWHSIIQLNLIRSIQIIMDTLADVRPHELPSSPPSPTDSDAETDSNSADAPVLPTHLSAILARLAHLKHVEALLIARLVPPSEEAPYLPQHGIGQGHVRINSTREVFVRPGKHALRQGGWESNVSAGGVGPPMVGQASQETASEVQAALFQCHEDLIALWHDPTVRTILRLRKIRLEEGPGFFLDELDRITSMKYTPSDDDVLKARLKTVGVSEYRFEMEAGTEQGTQWRIIDVGGSRSQVQTWVPFFDDGASIIFLAPISGFDQTLAEDKSVNRLEDSVLLWKAVCANKLLARVDLVLFLNKCDILAAKLASGIRLAKYVRSFGERPNDSETAEKYFRSKFNAIHREYSPIPRKFYGFCTSVTDTTTTGGIIASVRDMVVREHLRASKLL